MELMEKLASMLASLMISTAGGGGQALHRLLELILFITILIAAALARPIALRVAWVRRPLDPGARFAGRYVQIINSEGDPKRFDLRFIKLARIRLREFGLRVPTSERQRVEFVRGLHEKLQDHPELQPIEESGNPLL